MEIAERTRKSASPEPTAGCGGGDDGICTWGREVSVCVVCCATPSMSNDVVHAISRALDPVATVRTIVLSDFADTSLEAEVMIVPPGTKLSKIRRLAATVDGELMCICDPDMRVDTEACRLVFEKAASEARHGEEVVAFGIVEGSDNGNLLSRVIAMDKWLSHRVLRRALWGLGIGITLPGQFLVASTALLRSLDPNVDSYLDDLYLGCVARSRGVIVHRLPVVVGEEEARASWGGLLCQRLRWMKGLARLFGHLVWQPSAACLLIIHFLAYHGLPILVFLSLAILIVANPLAGAVTLALLIASIANCSGHSYLTTAAFLIVFPIVHCLAALLWWIPASDSYLSRR